SIISVAIAYLRYKDYKTDHPAIVFPKEVTVNSEPNNRSQEAFKLHEGTKVQVLEKLGDWNKISLTDGKTGWIPSTDIKLIKDFYTILTFNFVQKFIFVAKPLVLMHRHFILITLLTLWIFAIVAPTVITLVDRNQKSVVISTLIEEEHQ